MRRKSLLVVVAALVGAAAIAAPSAQAAPAEVAYALSGTNLLTFELANPSGATSTAIVGITAGETLRGIDVGEAHRHGDAARAEKALTSPHSRAARPRPINWPW